MTGLVMAGAGSDRVAGAMSHRAEAGSPPVCREDGFYSSADSFGPTLTGGGASETPSGPANNRPADASRITASSLGRDDISTAGIAGPGHATFSFVRLVAASPAARPAQSGDHSEWEDIALV
ncbi:hypothetical protein [Rhodopila sp.]|uniref:hypothetical protein n=1 Tax=Rhodopila sp. TaxID=2480087 RepID=UPI003D13A69C